MLRLASGESGRWRVRLTAVVVGLASILVSASGAWALFGGGTAPVTFQVMLDGETVTTAKAYAIEGALASGKREYTLRLSLQLTDDAAPARSFQDGQTFASARIALLDATFAFLTTYTLANATVVAYRQSGDAATNTFTQELVLRSKSLIVE